jgi:peptidyl-prolyl cis-trans isomerase SurA
VGREVRGNVEVTSADVRKYYEENKEELPGRPEEVELAHVVAYPVSREMVDEARSRMEAARSRIVGGESFETVAAELSDDPSKSRGGLLGWFQPGDLDPDFEAAADSLELGEISPPVLTRFGYHLIEVLERDGDRFRVRHILALFDVSEEKVAEAREKMERARARILGGDAFETVAREMSEDEATREKGGNLGWTPVQFLVKNVAEMLDSLEVEEVSPVVESDRGFHVFKILNKRSGGEFEFEEIEERLRAFLEQQKLEQEYDKWMQGVRDSAYIEIKSWDHR